MRFGNDMITFEEAVAYLKDMPRFTVKKNPADSRDLKWFLKKLGNPEKNLRIIHVAVQIWKLHPLCTVHPYV